VVSEKGFGKRTVIDEYRITNRGGKGVKTINVTEKTGSLVGVLYVKESEDLIITCKSGITIRTGIEDIREAGRATQGVTLIRLDDGDEIAAISQIEEVQSGLFLDGIRAFNKKNWELASSDFKSSIELSDVMFKNKWTDTKMTFDSTSVLYLAYAYQNGGKPAEAIKYYTRLADNKATGINGESIEDSYKFIVNYYSTQKDEANFKKYVGVARELFPKFPADEFEIDYLDNNYTLQQKADLFDKDDAAGTMSEQKYLTFGDIFVHAKDKEKLDSATGIKYTQKAGEAFKKAFAKNPQNAIAAFNVGIIYYNIYSAYDDKHAYNIRSMQAINSANAEKPAEKDPKKKAAADAALKAKLDPFKAANVELEKPMMDNLDVSLEWLEKSYTILKDKPQKTNTEKNIASKSVDFLANLYAYKRDRLKGKDQKAFELYDAKYKMYDDLHGKP
jgi:hypothetical protein